MRGPGRDLAAALWHPVPVGWVQRSKVDRLVRWAVWSYYVRPRHFFSRLPRSSPASLWRELRLFAGYFRQP